MDPLIILYGGFDGEAPISWKSASNVLKACVELGHEPSLINVSRLDLYDFFEREPDCVVLNMVHGQWGEDGEAQELFEELQIKYFGSSSTGSRITFDKSLFRGIAEDWVRLPKGKLMTKDEYDKTNQAYPHIVKIPNSGSSIGVSYICTDMAKRDLLNEWESDRRIVEEFIDGVEGSVTVYRGKVVGGVVIKYKGPIFDYITKYDLSLQTIGDWSVVNEAVRTEITTFAEKIFNKIGLGGIVRIDFRLCSKGVPYILDVNTIPGMTTTSLVPFSFKQIGLGFNEVVQKMIDDATCDMRARRAPMHIIPRVNGAY